MKPYQNEEIVEAIEETAQYVHLLDALRNKVYQGCENLKKTVAEVFQDLHDKGIPRGIVPANPNTLGKYLSSMADMKTGEVAKLKTKKANFYVFNFPPGQE